MYPLNKSVMIINNLTRMRKSQPVKAAFRHRKSLWKGVDKSAEHRSFKAHRAADIHEAVSQSL